MLLKPYMVSGFIFMYYSGRNWDDKLKKPLKFAKFTRHSMLEIRSRFDWPEFQVLSDFILTTQLIECYISI